jgi:hypothetical protein
MLICFGVYNRYFQFNGTRYATYVSCRSSLCISQMQQSYHRPTSPPYFRRLSCTSSDTLPPSRAHLHDPAMTDSPSRRDGLQRSAARNKSYIDLTAESDDSDVEMVALQTSKKENQGTKRKRVGGPSVIHPLLRGKFRSNSNELARVGTSSIELLNAECDTKDTLFHTADTSSSSCPRTTNPTLMVALRTS